jgi:lactate dehydrogenase-like 2-hydroxyacid dehydrogenase
MNPAEARETRPLKTTDVLMMAPMMPLITKGVSDAFTVHRVWEAPDGAAFLAEVAPRIRGMAAGGHVRVDGALMDRLPKLEVIANFGVGYDSIDAARRDGAASW